MQMQAEPQGEQRQEAGDRDCRSKSFGARAARRVLPRGEEGCVHTAWRAGSGPAEAARQAGMWGRERREGRFASSLPRLLAGIQRVAGGGRRTHEQKDHRVTRGSQARVPSKHATYRNRTAVQCVARSGDKRPQQKGFSLKQYTPGRPPGCATFACAYRACSRADGQAASTQARLHRAVRRAQGGAGLHSGCQLRRCKRRQKRQRQEAGGRDCRSKNFGARAARRELPRGEEGGVHTAWRAGSGPAEAARQAGMWGRERGEGKGSHRRFLACPQARAAPTRMWQRCGRGGREAALTYTLGQ